MRMQFVAVIKDSFPGCPGETISAPYPTRKEAQFYAEREIAAAANLFKEGAKHLSFIVKQI